jgi:site-specific recombinase XerD
MSASIKVVLFTHKVLKNGEHPIYLRVIKDRKTKYITLGSCSLKMWDEKENMPKKKHPLYKELSILVEKKRLEAKKLLYDLDTHENGYSSDNVKSILVNSNSKTSVIKYFDEVIERLEKSNRIGYANIFKSTQNSLSTFMNGKDIVFSDITPSFINKYEAEFLSRGVKPNSIFVYMRTFKTLINYARSENVVKTEYNPFKDISFTKYRRIKTAKRAISKDQIQAIAKLKFKPDSSIFHAQKYFLFSYYNRGINFIDIAFLRWSSVNNNKLTYTRSKTKEFFNIGMLDPASEILKFYKRNYPHSETDFIFPILNHSHETAKSIDYRVDKVLKQVNKDLKTIGEMANIKEKLTTYVARHSYATNMRNSGISVSVISKAMGHDSEKTTEIYLEQFDNSILDEASKAIL